MSDAYNPIQGVRAVGGSTWTELPSPSKYQYILSDISADDAGRTEDMEMHKERLGQYRKLELSWPYLTNSEISTVLQAFQDEYFEVKFLDALSGTWDESVFYVGDRTAPLYNGKMGLWESVAFNIIEKAGYTVNV